MGRSCHLGQDLSEPGELRSGRGDEATLVRLRAHALASGQTASEVAYAILGEGLQLERDDDDGHEGLRP
jgi:hypothetical protein